MVKKAIITGITGQDGSYLTELLLGKGYEVHGLIRRSSTFSTDRIDRLYVDPHEKDARLVLHYGDMADGTSLRRLLQQVQTDEIYNLAAQSHVKVSYAQAEYTADVVATGTLRLLEALRDSAQATGKAARFYQAGSSEMFGAAQPPQNEHTPFHPRSPYAASKVAAHWYAVNAREAYGLFVTNGILFNHESERRGETFVTRKITRAVGRIKLGLQRRSYLGNLEARRDWGHASDYVAAMWLMLQHSEPDDFVIATGESHSVREFLEQAFNCAGLDWREWVQIDPRYFRPAEVNSLEGDSAKARRVLGWRPQVSFAQLVERMVEHDIRLAQREKLLRDAGCEVFQRGTAV